MKLQIGDIIHSLRKEKQITQQQLADYLNVSKGAVSKWESGSSYPDILLLPSIATYFGVSIDTLLNYNINIDKEKMNNIKNKLEEIIFEDEEKGITFCNDYINKYPNDYSLKYELANSLMNYVYMKYYNDISKASDIINGCIDLYKDSQDLNEDEILSQDISIKIATLYMMIKEYDKSIELLKQIPRSINSIDIMLSNIYSLKGEYKKSQDILNESISKNKLEICLNLKSLALNICESNNDFNLAKSYVNKSINIKQVLTDECNLGTGIYDEYMLLSVISLKANNKEESIAYLNKAYTYIKNKELNELELSSIIMCLESDDFKDIKSHDEYKIIINNLKS